MKCAKKFKFYQPNVNWSAKDWTECDTTVAITSDHMDCTNECQEISSLIKIQ